MVFHGNVLHNNEEKYFGGFPETKSFQFDQSGYVTSSQSNPTYPVASSQEQQEGR